MGKSESTVLAESVAAFARMEGEAVFAALASEAASIELAGDPVPRLNDTLCGFSSLPLRLSS